MADLVRVASLSGYFETMAALGADPRPLLKEQGLDASLLSRPEQLITAPAVIRLLERSAQVTGCVTLGLRMAEGRSLANLGAASLLIAHQPTLRQALAALTEYRAQINSTLLFHVEMVDDDAILREDFALRRPESARQSSNLALAVLLRICQLVVADDWRPRTVCFTHEAVPTSERPLLERLFKCPPQYGCAFNGIVIARADLDRPNPRADEQLARHARQLLETVMPPPARTTAGQVDQLIRLHLPAGKATIQSCAATLGITVRTLQRRLDAENESFTDVLNRARMQLATEYLANPQVRVTDVAELLGYSTIGAFTRWHSQTFGLPPRLARKRSD